MKKSEAFEHFIIFKEMVENETDLKIKMLRLDNGSEFTSNEFWSYYEEHGIKRKLSTTRKPQKMVLLNEKIELWEKWTEPC